MMIASLLQEEHTRADPFVIYNLLGYSNLRTSITRAAYGKQFNDLVEESNVRFKLKTT